MRMTVTTQIASAAILTLMITGWVAPAMTEMPCECTDDAEAEPGQTIVAVDKCLLQELQRRFPDTFAALLPLGGSPGAAGADALQRTPSFLLAPLQSFFANHHIGIPATTATSLLLQADVADVQSSLNIHLTPLVSAASGESPEAANLLRELFTVEPNFFVSSSSSEVSTSPASEELPNDPLLLSQWAFSRTKVLETWLGANGRPAVQGSSISKWRCSTRHSTPVRRTSRHGVGTRNLHNEQNRLGTWNSGGRGDRSHDGKRISNRWNEQGR